MLTASDCCALLVPFTNSGTPNCKTTLPTLIAMIRFTGAEPAVIAKRRRNLQQVSLPFHDRSGSTRSSNYFYSVSAVTSDSHHTENYQIRITYACNEAQLPATHIDLICTAATSEITNDAADHTGGYSRVQVLGDRAGWSSGG